MEPPKQVGCSQVHATWPSGCRAHRPPCSVTVTPPQPISTGNQPWLQVTARPSGSRPPTHTHTAPEGMTTGGPSNTPGPDPHTAGGPGTGQRLHVGPGRQPKPRPPPPLHPEPSPSPAGGLSVPSPGRAPACTTGESTGRSRGRRCSHVHPSGTSTRPSAQKAQPHSMATQGRGRPRVCAAGRRAGSPHTACCALVKVTSPCCPPGSRLQDSASSPWESGCTRRTLTPRERTAPFPRGARPRERLRPVRGPTRPRCCPELRHTQTGPRAEASRARGSWKE